MLKRTDPIFLHNLPSHAAPTPLWPLLLLGLVCIFPLDVCVRRVFIDPVDVRQGVRAALEKMRLLRPKPSGQAERETTMTRLMAAKDQAIAKPAQPTQDREGPDFLKRAMQAKAAATPERGDQAPPQEEAKPDLKPEATDEESYTQQLLKAKRRARKKLE